jgi:hypothetical protein
MSREGEETVLFKLLPALHLHPHRRLLFLNVLIAHFEMESHKKLSTLQ